MPPKPPDIPTPIPPLDAQAAPSPRADSLPLSHQRFAELFEKHSRTLWCVAVSVLGDREGARDVVQESAIIALRKLSDFDPSTNFVAWMSQVVKYTAMNEVRRRGRRREKAGHEAADNAGLHQSASLPHPGTFDEHVAAALGELEETPRACLLMKAVLGLEYKDISDALGIPEGTAMSHVFRARKLMRTRLVATHGTDDERAASLDPAPRTRGGR